MSEIAHHWKLRWHFKFQQVFFSHWLIRSHSPDLLRNIGNIFNNHPKKTTKNVLLMSNLTPNNKRSRMFKKCEAHTFSMVMLCIQAFEKKARMLGEENGGRQKAKKVIWSFSWMKLSRELPPPGQHSTPREAINVLALDSMALNSSVPIRLPIKTSRLLNFNPRL